MPTMHPKETRKRHCTLGGLAEEQPLQVAPVVPFPMVPTDTLAGASGQIPGACPAPSHPFKLPETLAGPEDKSLSGIVSEQRR